MKTNNRYSQTSTFLRSLIGVCVVAIALIGSSAEVYAQGNTQPSFEAGPYIFNFGLTAGYRSVTTEAYGGNPSAYWDAERYDEAMNYRTGLNISSFSLYGERSGKDGFFDEMFLNAEGIGDPYTSASFRMRSFNNFDLKLDYHNNKYFMNRDDSIYTGLHKFDMDRQTLNGSLSYMASDAVTLAFLYNSTGHTGNYTTTVSPYIDGGEALGAGNGTGDGNFGTYARGNFYWMNSPKNDQTNEYILQGTFKLADRTAVTLGGGYRYFTQDINLTPVNDTSLTYYSSLFTPNAFSGIYGNFPNSAKTVATSNNNPLLAYTWDDNRVGKTPEFFLEGVSRPMDKLSITANLRYENTSTDGSTIKGDLLGIMPTAPSSIGGPKTAGQRTIADTTMATNNNTLKTWNASLTVAGNLTDELVLTGLYRYTNTDLSSNGSLNANVGTNDTVTKTLFRSLYDANFSSTITNTVTQHMLEGFVNYTPISMLNIRAGVQYSIRNPNYNRIDDGAADSATNEMLSRQQRTLTPFVNFWYRPINELKISGSYSHDDTKSYEHGTSTSIDLPIRIDPLKTDKYSVGLDVDPMKDLRVNLQVKGMNGSSDLLNMATLVETYNPTLTTKMMSYSAAVNYRIVRSTTLIVSGEYRSNDFSIPVSYTRGSLDPLAPYGDSLTILVAQHTIDRSLDASLMVNEITDLRVLLGYSMIVSTGGSYVSPDVKTGAPDLVRVGGPYTWGLLHVQATYDFTKNFAIMADYQLAMQKEDGDAPLTNVQNNYKASLIRGSVIVRL